MTHILPSQSPRSYIATSPRSLLSLPSHGDLEYCVGLMVVDSPHPRALSLGPGSYRTGSKELILETIHKYRQSYASRHWYRIHIPSHWSWSLYKIHAVPEIVSIYSANQACACRGSGPSLLCRRVFRRTERGTKQILSADSGDCKPSSTFFSMLRESIHSFGMSTLVSRGINHISRIGSGDC